jgi:DNA-binding transcriptional ArsR family regulator
MLSESDQLQRLSDFFANRDPGAPPPDPAALGAPRDYDVAAWAVELLQEGRDPDWVYDRLPPPLLATILAQAAPTAAPGLKTLSAYEILTTDWPDPVWAIPDLLPVGLSVLAGKPKVGKSWLALQIAQAVATGGHALGKTVTAGPVLYLALEDSPRRLRSRMELQGWPVLPQGQGEFMTLGDFDAQIGPLSDPLAVTRLTDHMHRGGYRLVVIDTLSRAIRGDQNDADTMTRALSPLQAAAIDLNCVALVVDHHRKANLGDTDPILDLGGSVAKGGVSDCIWGLYRERGKYGAILHVLGRDVDECRLKLTHDHTTGCWQSEGDADALKVTEARGKVLAALEELGGPATCKEIVEASGADYGNTNRLLKEMAGDGAIIRRKEGQKIVYSLLPQDAEPDLGSL